MVRCPPWEQRSSPGYHWPPGNPLDRPHGSSFSPTVNRCALCILTAGHSTQCNRSHCLAKHANLLTERSLPNAIKHVGLGGHIVVHLCESPASAAEEAREWRPNQVGRVVTR